MNRKYFYYIVFGVSFLTFGLVQDYIRPNYEGGNDLIIYFLGVIPNFLPGIGLPSMFYVTIPEIFKPNTSIYSCLLYTSPSPRDKRQSRMPSSA